MQPQVIRSCSMTSSKRKPARVLRVARLLSCVRVLQRIRVTGEKENGHFNLLGKLTRASLAYFTTTRRAHTRQPSLSHARTPTHLHQGKQTTFVTRHTRPANTTLEYRRDALQVG